MSGYYLPYSDELIEAVIVFANAKTRDGRRIRKMFPEPWIPDREGLSAGQNCAIRRETREWLQELVEGNFPADAVDAYKGGIELVGRPDAMFSVMGSLNKTYVRDKNVRQRAGKRETIFFEPVMHWQLKKATFRALCGLGVAQIYQAALEGRLRLCSRDVCANFFIDRRSRGEPRMYCMTDACNKARKRVSALAAYHQRKKKK